jgi:alpha-tubulin suppressor-like RCC1 family protein
VLVNSVAVGWGHALALTEDGLVYAWGGNTHGAVLGNPHVEREPLLKPVEALRGVLVRSIAAGCGRSYAVADTGAVWAWGTVSNDYDSPPLGHGERGHCPLPKPIASLRGVKVDAVAAGRYHVLALADSGRVYAWGNRYGAETGALGLGSLVRNAGRAVSTPQRILALRVACGL